VSDQAHRQTQTHIKEQIRPRTREEGVGQARARGTTRSLLGLALGGEPEQNELIGKRNRKGRMETKASSV